MAAVGRTTDLAVNLKEANLFQTASAIKKTAKSKLQLLMSWWVTIAKNCSAASAWGKVKTWAMWEVHTKRCTKRDWLFSLTAAFQHPESVLNQWLHPLLQHPALKTTSLFNTARSYLTCTGLIYATAASIMLLTAVFRLDSVCRPRHTLPCMALGRVAILNGCKSDSPDQASP